MATPNFKSKGKKKAAAQSDELPDWHEAKLADFKAAVLEGKDNAALSVQFPKSPTQPRGDAGLNAKRFALAQAIVSILPDPRDERCLHAISLATRVPIELIKKPTPEAVKGSFTELAMHRKPAPNDLIKKFADVAVIPTSSSAKVVKKDLPSADHLLETVKETPEFELDIEDEFAPPKPKAPVKTEPEVTPELKPKPEVKEVVETKESILELTVPIPPKRTYEPPAIHPRLLLVSDKDVVNKLDSLEKKLEDFGKKFDMLIELQKVTNQLLSK